jgi:hypothetical protein
MLSAVVATAAAAAGTGPDVVGWLVAQGPVGVLALVIAYGYRMERARADSERARADAERARGDAERASKDALARELIDKIVPALGESTRATRDLLDYAKRGR